MDWQAGKGLELSHHQQAMFLSRGLILSKVCGIEKPYLTLAHSEFEERGAGLVYRKPLQIAGKSDYMIPKPAFLSYLITQNWMEGARCIGPCEIREREPFFTRCYLFDAPATAFAKGDAQKAFEIVERQLGVLILRTQVLLSLSGIVITVTGFSGRARPSLSRPIPTSK